MKRRKILINTIKKKEAVQKVNWTAFYFVVPLKFTILGVIMTTRTKVRFKEVTSQQNVLFPTNLSDRIPETHPVRIVNQVVDQLNIDDILAGYKGGGTSSYHPRVMIKILFYSYFNNEYSSRKIEQKLHENIYYMWLSGNSTPNFRTINDFRGKRLKDKIHYLFAEMVKIMAELGYVSLNKQYVDGTKIEASSNKYTFVWKGSVQKYKDKLETRINAIIENIEEAIKSDNQTENTETKPIVNSEELSKRISKLNKHLDSLNKRERKQVEKLDKEHLPKLQKYEKQLKIMGERNSYSKTDTDATFMRMKDDHMKNGQLKAAYNIQISTENQFITNFSLHQRPGDTATLIPHLSQFKQFYNKQSKEVIADAGYGSEQNYEHAQENEIEAYYKYNYFHKEQKRKYKNNPFLPTNLFYNKQQDFYVCPMGQKMFCIKKTTRTSKLGYESNVHIYQAQNCKGCPMRGQCHKGKGNRRIEINHRMLAFRKKAKDLLMNPKGIEHRSKRPIEPEAVFGQIKFDNQFTRFKLRGLEKVNIEFGLVAISHNLRKLAAILQGLSPANLSQLALFPVLIHFWVKIVIRNRKIKIENQIPNFKFLFEQGLTKMVA